MDTSTPEILSRERLVGYDPKVVRYAIAPVQALVLALATGCALWACTSPPSPARQSSTWVTVGNLGESMEDPERASMLYREFSWPHAEHRHGIRFTVPILDLNQAIAQLAFTYEAKLAIAKTWLTGHGWPVAFLRLAQESGEPVDALVVSFVQSLPYSTSPVPGLLPAQTLAVGRGDCDDKAILAAGLLAALGFDAALYWAWPSHMGVTIANAGYSGWHTERSGKTYVFVEVSSPGWAPGEMDEKSQTKPAILIFPTEGGQHPGCFICGGPNDGHGHT